MDKLNVFFSLCVLLWCQISFAQNHKFEWVDFSDDFQWEQTKEVLIDDQDYNYTIGIFDVSFDADPGPLVQTLTSNGGFDCYIRKMDTNKNLIWAISYGSQGPEDILSASIDDQNNLIVIGVFEDTMDLDPGPAIFEIQTDTKSYFIQKFDSSGTFIWGTAINHVSFTVPLIDIACDDAGDVYVAGAVLDSLDFDPGTGSDMLYSNGEYNGFLAKYSTSGNLLWKIELEGDGTNFTDVEVDSNNDLIIAGNFKDNIDFDLGVGNVPSFSPSESRAFVLKTSPNADFIWVKSLEGSGHSVISDLELGIGDTINLYGFYFDTVDFDPGPGTFELVAYQNPPFSSEYLFISKLTPSGDFLWVKDFGADNQDFAWDMLVADNGDIYVSGGFQQTVDFDPDPMNEFNLTASGSYNWFYSKFTHDGDFEWVKSLSTYYGHNSMAMDSQGAFYWGATYGGTVDFDPGYGTSIASDSYVAHFLLKLEPCVPSESIDTVVVCSASSYTWINGFTYTSNNTSAKMILEAANGCDSIVSLNLTFANPVASVDAITACNSYTWIDGITYTSNNNTATFTYTSITGCDSVVTLDLTIIPNDTTIDVIHSCSSYTWIDGVTYTNSNNTAQMVYTNSNGCDSIVQLDLTVGAPTSGTDIISACNSYTWIDGNTYTSSNNTAQWTLTNAQGCDSVVTLNLTLQTSTTGTDIVTACDSYTWIDGNTYNSSNNTATHIIPNAVGCDSVITLDLTINTATASVTSNDPELVADPGATSYQWLDCLNGNTPIAGATSNVFVATSNGEYAVVIEENGCTDTSACIVVNNVGLVDLEIRNWTVHPNPTNGSVTVSFDELPAEVYIEVTNPIGQVVSTLQVNTSEVELDLGSESGVYFVRVISESREDVVPVVKMN